MRKGFVQQGIRQLFSAGQDREATEILVDHIMLVSPGADRERMLRVRSFVESGKLEYWDLGHCKISKLPPSFGALVCSGSLNLSGSLSFGALVCNGNKLESVPKSFSRITVGGTLNLPKALWRRNSNLNVNFLNVKGIVYRRPCDP